ncbi:MAG: hypothetical protein FWD33_01865 [Alphaproteobacteria bacterium]|nr:hypothetical protein [Alphaproteobacteria bacterium]
MNGTITTMETDKAMIDSTKTNVHTLPCHPSLVKIMTDAEDNDLTALRELVRILLNHGNKFNHFIRSLVGAGNHGEDVEKMLKSIKTACPGFTEGCCTMALTQVSYCCEVAKIKSQNMI